MFIGGQNGEIEFINYESFNYLGKADKKLKGHVYDLFYVAQQDILIAATSHGQIGVWKAKSMTLLQMFSNTKIGRLTSIEHKTLTGEFFISGFKTIDQEYKGFIYVFKLSKEPVQISMVDCIDQNTSYIYYIKLDKQRKYIYGCGGKGLVFKYDLNTNGTEFFVGHKHEVWKLLLLEEKQLLLSAGYD